jgi:hypothetical protein
MLSSDGKADQERRHNNRCKEDATIREDLIARQSSIKKRRQSKRKHKTEGETFMRHFSFLYLFLKMQYLQVHFINPITNHANPTYLCNVYISTTLALHVIFIDQFCSR